MALKLQWKIGSILRSKIRRRWLFCNFHFILFCACCDSVFEVIRPGNGLDALSSFSRPGEMMVGHGLQCVCIIYRYSERCVVVVAPKMHRNCKSPRHNYKVHANGKRHLSGFHSPLSPSAPPKHMACSSPISQRWRRSPLLPSLKVMSENDIPSQHH